MRPKEERFCHEFTVDHNATQAALRAGYKKGPGLRVTAARLLAKANVAALIAELEGKLLAKVDSRAERVIQEAQRIAFLDPGLLFGADGQLLDIEKIPEDARRALCGFDLEELKRIGGKAEGDPGIVRQVRQVRKVRLVDKVRALELLMKHHGLLVEKVQVDHRGLVDGRTITAEEWAELAMLRHVVRPRLKGEDLPPGWGQSNSPAAKA